MTKKRSKNLFVVFAVILVVCLIATFFSFTYPFAINGKFYSYSSFISNVRLGEDISTSLKVVYRAEMIDEYESITNYDNLRNSTINKLQSILQKEGYSDSTIASYGEDSIVVQIGDLLNNDDAETVLSLIENPGKIYFSMSNKVEEAFADATDVSEIRPQQVAQNGVTSWYVVVIFKDEVHAEIAEKTANGGTLYILFGEDEDSTISMSISSAIENGLISITGTKDGTIPWDRTDATTYANKLSTGLLDLKLTKLSDNIVKGSYGSFTNYKNQFKFGSLSALFVWIALGIMLLAGFVYLIVKYKQIGWVGCFNLLFFVCLSLFIIQSIPILHLNFAGMLALALCFILSIDGLLTIFERAKKYYNSDTKLHVAFKTAQKDSLFKILIQNALLIVAGFVCVFMPVASIQSFGWVAIVLPIISLFTNLALMRLFIKMYLGINNFDGKKCNFHKGGKNA